MIRIAVLSPETASAAAKFTFVVCTKSIGFAFDVMMACANSPLTFNAWTTLIGSLTRALLTLDIPHFA